ncbi:ATP-binding protein, partial [Patescibacteria group bacterium]|nr:ATP-binding protein [Patescibacteria group bacterium]
MAIRIKRIQIKNFKLFDELSVEFDNPDLVVFDGPNGFGKTSFYDAIELLFTGRIRRYEELISKAVDKRQSVTGSPFLNDQSGSGDLIIKCEFEVDGKNVCLMRQGKREELEAATSLNNFNLQLYTSNNFDSEDFSMIEDENVYLSSLLGVSHKENFEFLNYIEQEENIYLLKNKDKNRKDAIAHLFNTANFEERIGKLTGVSKKLIELCGKEANASLSAQRKKLDDYRGKYAGDLDRIPFTRLITWKDIPWDQEELEFPDEKYVEWLGKEGELAELELFLHNIAEFRNDRENQKLDILLSDEVLIPQFLLCWSFIDDFEYFSKKFELKRSIDELVSAFEQGVLQSILQGKLEPSPQVQEIIKPIIDLGAYSLAIADIIGMNKRATTISKLLVEVKDSRQIFINKFTKFEAESEPNKDCPLCGYSWKDAEELKLKFDAQKEQLEQLI